MKKLVSLILAIALLLSLTSFAYAAEPGYLKDTSPITLSWYVNFSWFGNTWGEDLFSKTVTEETGISVNYIAPAGTEADKLNALIISDELPDILTMDWTTPQIEEMITGDMLYALDELAEKYDPYFFDVAVPSRLNWYTQEDGHVYGYPNASFSPDDYEKYDTLDANYTFLVRKDMYEAIGSPDMTTPEGFIAAVKAAKEMFPTVDGQTLIPIGSHNFTTDSGCISFDKMLFDFLAVPYLNSDGTRHDRYTDEEYIRWLKVFRELGEEGYLEDDIFIDQRDQISEKIAQGRYFCMLYQNSDLTVQQKILWEKTPENPGSQIYLAIDGPKNSKGDDYVLGGNAINGWTLTFISKNCKNPDRAIELVSYMLSEHGQHLIWMGGNENEVWNYDENSIPRWIPEIQDMYLNRRSDSDGYDATIGGDAKHWMLMDNAMGERWKGEYVEYIRQIKAWTSPYVTYLGQYEVSYPLDTPSSNAHNRINILWSTTLPKLLLAKSDAEFNTLLTEFTAKRDELGYALETAEYEAQVHANIERLGMK